MKIKFTKFLKNFNNNFLGNFSQKSTTIWDLPRKKGGGRGHIQTKRKIRGGAQVRTLHTSMFYEDFKF
jgi:hypothetical protein